MDTLNIVAKINNKIEHNQLPNRGYNKVAPCFIGDSTMNPQIDTGFGWGTQTVDGMMYYKEKELWLSSQLFKHQTGFKVFYTTITKSIYLDLSEHTYLESVVVNIQTSEGMGEIIVDDVITPINSRGIYYIDYEAVFVPAQIMLIEFNPYNTDDINVAVETKYRFVL